MPSSRAASVAVISPSAISAMAPRRRRSLRLLDLGLDGFADDVGGAQATSREWQAHREPEKAIAAERERAAEAKLRAKS
jgi:hypothetical protein